MEGRAKAAKVERILEAYLDLAHEQGVETITLEKVAKRAGVAYGTVRYHFNERDLSISHQAAAHVGKHAQDFVSTYLEGKPASARQPIIVTWFEANLKWAEAHPTHASQFVYFYYLCTTRVRGRELNRAFLDAAARRIAELLYMDIGRGRIAKREGVEEMAIAIHGLAIGTILRALTDPDLKSWRSVQTRGAQALRACISSFSSVD